jgi:hypothetical protein
MRLTIRHFQEISKIADSPLDELEKSSLIVKVVTGKNDYQINKMSYHKFNKICRIVKRMLDNYTEKIDKEKPRKFIRVHGVTYMLHYDITRLTAGKYVEAVEFQKDMIGNLHKLLATMAVPMRWTWKGLRAKPYKAQDHAKIAEDMLDADFSVAYHACVFFCAVSVDSMKSLNISGKLPGLKNLGLLEKRLMNYLAGSITANWYRNLKGLN